MSDKLRYGMVIRLADGEVLISGSVSTNSKSYAKESAKIKEKMLSAQLKPNERKKIIGKAGNWLCECDGNNILYVTCTEPEPDYPERLGYGYIAELRKSLSEISNYYSMTPAEVAKNFDPTFQKLSAKYNDPKSFDSLSSVTSKVDLATKKMEDNIKSALSNQQDLTNVQSKTELLLAEAKDFNDNADELRKVMYWRNMKLKMIMTVMGGAASFSVVLPIIQKFAA